jgi:hypothetical protein
MAYVRKNSFSPSGKRLGRPPGRRDSRRVTKRPKGQKPPATKSTRGPGAPRAGEAPLTPAVSKQIARLWLIGTSLTEIAEQTGTHLSALSRHIDGHILPVFRSELAGEALRITGLLREAARISWQRVVEDRDDANSLRLFSWSVDNLLSISGAHAPVKLDVSQTYRVAGKRPEAIESEMLDRLAHKIETLRYAPAITVDEDPPGR